MKFIILTFLIFISYYEVKANNYQEGDTLYVVSVKGLSLRSGPDVLTEKITTLSAYDTLIVEKFKFMEHRDTIDQWIGNWIKVSTGTQAGYVFDAYITRFPRFMNYSVIEEGQYETTHFFSPMCLKEYAFGTFGNTDCQIEYRNSSSGESAHAMKLSQLEVDVLFIENSYYEGSAKELEFRDIRSSELYYLIQYFLETASQPRKYQKADFVDNYQFILPNDEIKELILSNERYFPCLVGGGRDSDCLFRLNNKGNGLWSINFIFPCC